MSGGGECEGGVNVRGVSSTQQSHTTQSTQSYNFPQVIPLPWCAYVQADLPVPLYVLSLYVLSLCVQELFVVLVCVAGLAVASVQWLFVHCHCWLVACHAQNQSSLLETCKNVENVCVCLCMHVCVCVCMCVSAYACVYIMAGR